MVFPACKAVSSAKRAASGQLYADWLNVWAVEVVLVVDAR